MATKSKRLRVLDQNAITEIVMDSDSEESYACEEMDEEQPGPSSWSSITRPASPDFSASSSEDDVMWQDNSHNPVCGHCPLNPKSV